MSRSDLSFHFTRRVPPASAAYVTSFSAHLKPARTPDTGSPGKSSITTKLAHRLPSIPAGVDGQACVTSLYDRNNQNLKLKWEVVKFRGTILDMTNRANRPASRGLVAT